MTISTPRAPEQSLQAFPREASDVERLLGTARTTQSTRSDAPVVIPFERGRSLEVVPVVDGAQLCVRDETGAALEIQIRFDPSGPIVGVRAQSLSLEASDRVIARCDTFAVHARQRIELVSEGEIVQKSAGNAEIHARNLALSAEPGAIRLQANDDVQLLGENVLLNCEPPRPLPEWARQRIRPEPGPPLAPETEAGARELVDFLGD